MNFTTHFGCGAFTAEMVSFYIIASQLRFTPTYGFKVGIVPFQLVASQPRCFYFRVWFRFRSWLRSRDCFPLDYGFNAKMVSLWIMTLKPSVLALTYDFTAEIMVSLKIMALQPRRFPSRLLLHSRDGLSLDSGFKLRRFHSRVRLHNRDGFTLEYDFTAETLE